MRFDLLGACLAAVIFHAMTATILFGQDAIEEGPPEISREAWKAKVEAARRRAEEIRRQRALLPPQPTGMASDDELSRRVVEDDSLQPGDIVSTNRGLFRFKGKPFGNREPNDFVPAYIQPSGR